jgi:SNF2 family DNA or RNA helicase
LALSTYKTYSADFSPTVCYKKCVFSLGFSHYEQFYHRFGDLKTPEQVKELHKVLKPYFLRRVKEDVAKFIPEKRETIIEVELTKVQKQVRIHVYISN